MRGAVEPRWTERLRLEPIEPRHADDLWRIHRDDRIATWFAGRWSKAQAERAAEAMSDAWRTNGVSKWIAYHRDTDELVGRGGCSRAEIDGETSVEIGWAIRDRYLRQGYASEIGRESISFAFGVLGVSHVLALTEVHNIASRAVMERIGMQFDKEIVRNGLVEGREGVHADARFAVYRINRPDFSSDEPGDGTAQESASRSRVDVSHLANA